MRMFRRRWMNEEEEAWEWAKDNGEEEEDEEKWEGEEQDDYELTELLGIEKALAERLKNAGYGSLWHIAIAEVDELVEIVGISRETAKKIINAANKYLGFEEEEELEEEENDEEEW